MSEAKTGDFPGMSLTGCSIRSTTTVTLFLVISPPKYVLFVPSPRLNYSIFFNEIKNNISESNG